MERLRSTLKASLLGLLALAGKEHGSGGVSLPALLGRQHRGPRARGQVWAFYKRPRSRGWA